MLVNSWCDGTLLKQGCHEIAYSCHWQLPKEETGKVVTWETILTKFFDLVSLDCAVEIQKLLVCAPLPPAQAAFYSEGVEEKLWAITAALLPKSPPLAESFHCKQSWLLCAVPLREDSPQRIWTESYSSSYAEVLPASSFSFSCSQQENCWKCSICITQGRAPLSSPTHPSWEKQPLPTYE